MASSISLNDIRIRAFHGCLEEEAIIGGQYRVDVKLDVDFSAAAEQDDLSLTVDYVAVSEIVHREMAIRSKLIETVAHRIIQGLKSAFPQVSRVQVDVTKYAAPMPGQVTSVQVSVAG